MFLSEKVFRLVQDNLNEKGYFIYSKVILSEMAGVSIRSLNRALSELKEKKLITILNGTIRLNI
jgi:DNA-binding GntR family transcriptional regulator